MTDDYGPVPAYGQYYKKVELQWSLARSNQIIVSPLEFEGIEAWYKAGVPLAVVFRAIDLFIEKKKKAKGKRSYLLTHVNGTVEKCMREYVTIHEGEGEEGDLLTSKMKGLVRKLKRLSKEHPAATDLIAELIAQLEGRDLSGVITYETVDDELKILEARLIDWFRMRLSEDEMAEIREDVSELLTEEEDPEFFQKLVTDTIRVHFALPHLTLLG